MKVVHSELVDVVLLTQENGSTMLCRGGEEAVRNAWNNWPIVKAEFTGEKQLLQWISADPEYDSGQRHM
tara:strand:+ start:290 stop:496 length:207 start_codon:yes stop_codon:yes gene_type:complete